MQLITFDTDSVAPAERLATFRAGAPNFRIDPLTEPSDFFARWRLLKLGDVNLIRSWIAPVRYRRDAALIERDGEDRVTIHVRLAGAERGTIDDEEIEAPPGAASVWDLARPLDLSCDTDSGIVILTIPRPMLRDQFGSDRIGGTLMPSAALSLATGEALRLLHRADDLPAAGAPFYGRALRDLFVAAMMPACRSTDRGRPTAPPLLSRICALIDADLTTPPEADSLAEMFGMADAAVQRTLVKAGGMAALTERRRLLAAYRLLTDPAETASISVIARRCGFADMPRFSRSFRAVFHASASELRRHQGSHLPAWAGAYHVEQSYRALMTA